MLRPGRSACFTSKRCAKKHVLRPSDVVPVQTNTRDRVEALGDELDVLVIAEVRLCGEPASVTPVALLDPLELLFVGSPERIRNSLVPEKVVMDAAGNLGLKPVARLRLEERPGRQREAFPSARGKELRPAMPSEKGKTAGPSGGFSFREVGV